MNDSTITGISDELYCAMQAQLQRDLNELKKVLIDCPYSNEANFVEQFKVVVRAYKRQQRHHDQITSLLAKMANASKTEADILLRRSNAQLQANSKVALPSGEPEEAKPCDPNDTPARQTPFYCINPMDDYNTGIWKCSHSEGFCFHEFCGSQQGFDKNTPATNLL